jgi:hypothetical protein
MSKSDEYVMHNVVKTKEEERQLWAKVLAPKAKPSAPAQCAKVCPYADVCKASAPCGLVI